MSEDKVRTKVSCWSVGTIYDLRELPGVSTAGPGIGQGVIEAFRVTTLRDIFIVRGSSMIIIFPFPLSVGHGQTKTFMLVSSNVLTWTDGLSIFIS
jgi:hypothetical protein